MRRFFKNPIKLKTVGEWGEIDSIVRHALTVQTILGQQLLDPDWSWTNVRGRFITGLFIFIYVTVGTLDFLNKSTDAELIAEAYYTLVMTVVFPIKLGLYVANRDKFRELYLEMKTTIINDIMEQSDLKSVLGKAKRLVSILFAMVVIPATNIELIALWGYVTGDRVPLSRTTSTFMSMTSPYYELGWFLHSIFLLHVSTTIILDMWFVLFIFILCSANETLVETITRNAKGNDENETLYGKGLNNILRKFYVKHVKQTKYLIKLNKMYKWLAFVPLCNAGMCVCIILILLSKDINWKFAPHFLPMIAEIFAYNYFGEKIKTKASDIKRALLDFDWTNLSARDKKNYHIILTFMQKEFGVKTGLGSDLSFITMTSVLQTTYRAFTMLQSV